MAVCCLAGVAQVQAANIALNDSFDNNGETNGAFDDWTVVSTSGGANWDAEDTRGSISTGLDGSWFAIAEDTARQTTPKPGRTES